jgi:hypothetical protein
MCVVAGAIVMAMIGLSDEAARVEPEHARNPVYAAVLKDGLQANGATARLPEPRLRDGQDAEAQRAALREVAGTDQKLDEMARDSVTAPYIIKVHDLKAADATIRVVDLWFVVHADIAEIDPAKEAAKADEKEVEAGNMVMRTRILKPEELRAAGITSPASSPEGSEPETWYAHIHGRLLDRIAFDVTNQVVATRTRESLVVAARTDPAFDKPGPYANGWKPVEGGKEDAAGGALKPYPGGISYTRISRLAFRPGALLVEMHGAFVEPHEWFQGAPILRSKFSIVAQDQIRSLRRELARRKKG